MATTTTAAATTTMLALKTAVRDSDEFWDEKEVTIVGTRKFNVPDKHLIKVTACWRSMSSTDAPSLVTLSITVDEEEDHKQEQNHRIEGKDTGQAGGEMSRVLKVRTQGGDITPGPHSFQLRAVRADTTSSGIIVIQAAKAYPTEIRVEDLGVIPSQL